MLKTVRVVVQLELETEMTDEADLCDAIEDRFQQLPREGIGPKIYNVIVDDIELT